jgi:hypothetical protein
MANTPTLQMYLLLQKKTVWPYSKIHTWNITKKNSLPQLFSFTVRYSNYLIFYIYGKYRTAKYPRPIGGGGIAGRGCLCRSALVLSSDHNGLHPPAQEDTIYDLEEEVNPCDFFPWSQHRPNLRKCALFWSNFTRLHCPVSQKATFDLFLFPYHLINFPQMKGCVVTYLSY